MNVSRFRRQEHLGVAPVPAARKGLRKGVYVVPSLFTSLNILAGFYSLMASMSGFSLLERGAVAEATVRFDHAAIAIGLAFLCDTLDGRIARMTKSTTEIGVQLDSLADVVSFGLAPAMLAYAWVMVTPCAIGVRPAACLVSVVHVRHLRRLQAGPLQCAGDAAASDGRRNQQSR